MEHSLPLFLSPYVRVHVCECVHVWVDLTCVCVRHFLFSPFPHNPNKNQNGDDERANEGKNKKKFPGLTKS